MAENGFNRQKPQKPALKTPPILAGKEKTCPYPWKITHEGPKHGLPQTRENGLGPVKFSKYTANPVKTARKCLKHDASSYTYEIDGLGRVKAFLESHPRVVLR